MPRKPRKDNYRTEMSLAAKLDQLAAFEEYSADILPALQAAVRQGKSAGDIRAMVTAVAAAKLATALVKETDPMKILALAKDIFDRSEGKATEKVEITSKLEKLSDNDLDALLKSKTSSASEASSEAEETQH